MPSIADITVDLIAESSQFRKELGKASKASDNWAKQVRSATNVAAKSIAAVGTAAAAGLAAMYTATAQSIDQQAKFADKIGISTEALAGLQYAGELTGVSANTLNMGLQRMTRRVAEAANGTGEAVQALDQLGLSAQQLNQMSPDEQFKAIAAAMGDVEGRSEQVRLAFKLFDSEGVALLNTLDMGVDGLAAMQGEAEMLGIAMSRVDAAKIEQANDAFYKTSLTTKGFTQSLTAELAPIVQGISEELVRAANEAGGFGEVASEVVDKLAAGFGFLADSIRGWEFIFAGIEQLWKETAYAFIHDITWIDQAITDLINKMPGINAAYNQTLQNMTREMGAELENSRQALHELVMQPLPSEQIDKYVHKWRELSEVQATAAANAKNYNDALITPPGGSGLSQGDEDKLNTELEKVRQSYQSQEQLLLEKTLNEQDILISAEQAKLMSEQESQALRQASWDQYYKAVADASEKSSKQQVAAQANADKQLLQMQMSLMGHSLGVIKGSLEEGSSAWAAATLAQQGLLATQAIMQAELAAAQTLAAMIIPGNPASVPAAMGMAQSMKMMGYANAAVIMAQGIADIAGAGAEGGSVIGGKTYLVGERGPELFTAGATGQITSHENLNKAIGNSSNANMNWTIIVNEAPPGTEVNVDEQRKTVEIAVAQTKNDIYDDFTRRGPLRRSLGV